MGNLILDVGCGSRPYRKRGCETVCIDIYADYTPQADDQRHLVKVEHGDYFVRASGEHIPFKDNVFPLVVARHTIEHVDKPFKMLSEMIRVSNQRIFIKCPHRFSIDVKKPFHKHYFNVTWFKKALKNFDIKYKILLSYRRVFLPKLPIKIILFEVPNEITIKISKS
jgi:SAM-dependent methyltransferase